MERNQMHEQDEAKLGMEEIERVRRQVEAVRERIRQVGQVDGESESINHF